MHLQQVFSIARFRSRDFSSVFLFGLLVIVPHSFAQADGRVKFRIDDRDAQPLPCRIHVKDEAGKSQRAAGLPFWKDHFVCPGKADLQLPDGAYTYLIERGPEYARVTGSFQVAEGDPIAKVTVALNRIAHMANMGWY